MVMSIICGDVLEVLEQDLGVFNVIIADPPYNIGKNFGNNKTKKKLEDYVSWSKKWIDRCLNLLKENGILYVYGFSEILAHIAVKYPIEKQKWMIWHYGSKVVPNMKFFQPSHESILALWSSSNKPRLEIDQIRVPYAPGVENRAGRIRKGSKGRFGTTDGYYKPHPNGKMPMDVISAPALVAGRGTKEKWHYCKRCDKVFRSPEKENYDCLEEELITHPTQKPLDLSTTLIRSAIKDTDVGRVLIPFAGSGTECLAAHLLGHDYLGIEMNEDYVNLATKKIENYSSLNSFLK